MVVVNTQEKEQLLKSEKAAGFQTYHLRLRNTLKLGTLGEIIRRQSTLGSEVLIEAAGLTKKFGDLTAVDGINFKIFKGECFGFLGPNGAGKTTTMKMIHCVLLLTSGKLTVAGMTSPRTGEKSRK
jgi:ABC-type uncharacterized transport system ATPase subunit